MLLKSFLNHNPQSTFTSHSVSVGVSRSHREKQEGLSTTKQCSTSTIDSNACAHSNMEKHKHQMHFSRHLASLFCVGSPSVCALNKLLHKDKGLSEREELQP